MSDEEERAQALRDLRTYPDVQPVHMERGQVLQYPGHYPLGIWVVLSGSLHGVASVTVPHLVPALADLDRPALRRTVVEQPADALFVPYSVAREDEAVRRLLARLAPQNVREVR